MYRGSTPTIILNIKNDNISLSSFKEIWITIKSINTEKTYYKSKDEIEIVENDNLKQLKIYPTQEDTLSFLKGKAEIQMRALGADETSYVSNIPEITINKVLKDGVIK